MFCFIAQDVAELVIRCLATFESGAKRIEEVFDLCFALDDVAQNLRLDLIGNECVVNELQLPGSQFIQLRSGTLPLPQLPEFFRLL